MRKKLSKIFYISKTTRLNIEMINHYDAVQYGTVWYGWDRMRCSTVLLSFFCEIFFSDSNCINSETVPARTHLVYKNTQSAPVGAKQCKTEDKK